MFILNDYIAFVKREKKYNLITYDNKKTDRSPWLFIPTQYFAEGLPYILVNNLSVVMYKSLGMPNDLIGYTSFLYLPWAISHCGALLLTAG